jgi:formate dehydrogenase maturation protein FdhE
VALDLWQAGIARAQALAEEDAAAAALLTFTASLLRAQRDIYTQLRSTSAHGNVAPLTGRLEADLPRLRPLLPPLLGIVAARGPDQHYLKAVDLATVGLAVPVVDEIAASALDVWAREQGLTKIERNLVGLSRRVSPARAERVNARRCS